MDYEVISIVTGKGKQLAAVRKNGGSEGQQEMHGRNTTGQPYLGDVLAIGDSEQELHEKVTAITQRKKFLGIF